MPSKHPLPDFARPYAFVAGVNCWQDDACTIPATQSGDPVRVWLSVDGSHRAGITGTPVLLASKDGLYLGTRSKPVPVTDPAPFTVHLGA